MGCTNIDILLKGAALATMICGVYELRNGVQRLDDQMDKFNRICDDVTRRWPGSGRYVQHVLEDGMGKMYLRTCLSVHFNQLEKHQTQQKERRTTISH
jgi:hypothetical protein